VSNAALANNNFGIAQIADGKLAIKEDVTSDLDNLKEGISQAVKAQPADGHQDKKYPDMYNYDYSEDEADSGYANYDDEKEAIDG
jgi:hypothetical protein